MTSVLVIDWLGRGGIAETSEAWASDLARGGHAVAICSRRGRDLDDAGNIAPGRVHRSGLAGHIRLTSDAVKIIREVVPDVVVIQNFLIPPLERKVHRAAREVGARVVFVVHDHHLHARSAGMHTGLASLLRRADVVITHSKYVGTGISTLCNRPVEVVSLPAPTGLIELNSPSPLRASDDDIAIHFGVVRRSYKGGDVFREVAKMAPPGWRFAMVGVGATPLCGGEAVNRFVSAGELWAAVRQSATTLLPYHYATQSAAVLFAQLAGSVPIASAVGGIPEQIVDGETGLLVPPDAHPEVWVGLLERLRDASERRRLSGAAREHAVGSRLQFSQHIARLVA
jgi:glycosyltransferase involved in cell wall biosynthesis